MRGRIVNHGAIYLHLHLAVKIALLAIISGSSLFLTGCGSGSGGKLQGKYSVSDVRILADDININETVRTEVFFETKFEVDGTPDGLDLIVRIPPELDYLPGSSRIYDNTTDNSDNYTPNNIINCDTGEKFLVYNFADVDLFGKELGNPGNFGIKFETIGVSLSRAAFIGAIAGREDVFGCGLPFEAEQNEAVEVK